MCGRFTYRLTWREIHDLYRLTAPAEPARNTQARYNVCPTTPIDVVVANGHGARDLVNMRWGLIPRWWSKTMKELPATFNARAETVAEKPMFRDAFKRHRCLIPMSGYYEWKGPPKAKQPFYFTPRGSQSLTAAGLWDEWKDRATGETIISCTMLITEANEFVAQYHNRMPVLLQEPDFEGWLDASAGRDLLRPASNDLLQVWPVSTRVGSSSTPDDDPTLIEPMTI